MAYNEDSLMHRMAFCYITFAHLTDADLSKAELTDIGSSMLMWLKAFNVDITGDGKTDAKDLNQLILKDTITYYNSLCDDERIAHMATTFALLPQQDWFNECFAIAFLETLKDLAKADGKYDDAEKAWIQHAASDLGVNFKA